MFDEEIFQEYVSLLEDGGEVVKSSELLSKKYNVTASAIRGWYYERRLPTEYHRGSALTEEQEEQLLYAILATSHVNLDWSIVEVQKAAKTMFGVDFSSSSAGRFKTRHKDVLSFRKSTSLSKKRVGEDLYEEALAFSCRFESFLSKKQLPPSAIINYDETCVIITDKSTIQVRRLISKKKNKPQHVGRVKGTHCGTYLPFVAADGKLLASYFILSSKFHEGQFGNISISLPSSFSRTRCGSTSPILFFNDSGYLNSEIFSQIIDHFAVIWEARHPGLHCCLIGDNLAAHKDLVVMKKALDKGIYLTFLVAGTTQWSQPLDNLLFARLKEELRTMARKVATLQVFTPESLISLVEIILVAANRAFSKQAIARAFRETGLVPLNVQKIEELAHLNHQPTDTPFEPTNKEMYIVENVVKGLQKCMDEVKKDVASSSQKLTPVRVRVEKNKLYLASDILAENERVQEEEEKKKKEALEEKEKKQEERKRKREDEEKEKEERSRVREEKRVKKAKELEKKAHEKEVNTCKAGCKRVSKKGQRWMGCENCLSYWVCGECYKLRRVQNQVDRHQNSCCGDVAES